MRSSRFSKDEIHTTNDALPTFHPRIEKSNGKPLLLKSSSLAQHLWLVILFIMLIACIALDVSMTSSSSVSSSSNTFLQSNGNKKEMYKEESEDNHNYNSSNARPASVISSWFPSATESSTEFFWEQEHSDTEVVSASPQHHLRPLVISGPSGVGKGTLIDMLLNHYGKDTFGFSVSETTRGPRPGEVHGQHYYFTERTAMEEEIKQGLFLEHAEVHGNLYGTSFQSVNTVTESGRICILDIDIQGVKHIHSLEDNKLSLPPHFIFIAPPSMELLEKRLRNRGTETEEAIKKRLGNARAEVEYGTKNGTFDHVIVNDDLSKAFFHLKMILEEWYPHIHLLQRIR